MNEYEKQANAFLKSTSATLSVRYLCNDYHFDGDTEKRDIYTVTLSNEKHSYTFKYGDSIYNSELRQSDRRKHKQPTAYGILACIQSFTGTFPEFCEDYGYDIDSRAAHRVYESVIDESLNLEKLFNSGQLEQLAAIQ